MSNIPFTLTYFLKVAEMSDGVRRGGIRETFYSSGQSIKN